MKRLLILSLACCLVCFWGASALAITPEAQPKVITSASKNVVEIGLSYSGDKIFFFGVNPVPGSDLVIKLTAEKEEAIKLSVKGKVGPLWMTVKQYEVTGSPFIYKIHATKPLDQIISKKTAQELELGYDGGARQNEDASGPGRSGPRGRGDRLEGVAQNQGEGQPLQHRGRPQRLEISEGKLFKHYFRFPPAATEGRYVVESFCFQNGELVGYGKDVIEIKKVGLEHWLTHTSQTQPSSSESWR